MHDDKDKTVKAKLKAAITSADISNIIGNAIARHEEFANAVVLNMGRSGVYDKIFLSLIKQFDGSDPQTFDNSVDGCLKFVSWLTTSKRSEVVSTTWNSYRCAVMAILPHPAVRKTVFVPAINGKKDVNKQNSGLRVKRMTDEVYTYIVQYLKKSSSKYSQAVMDLLFVIRKTGIRPVEILSAEVVVNSDFSFLKVMTAKKENRRYEGELITSKYPYRYIPLIHLDETELDRLLSVLSGYTNIPSLDVWDKLYEGMRFTFLRAVKNIGITSLTSSYSFYSARQQFSADLKATPISKSLVSLIMGHENEETIRNHYARKAYGKALFAASRQYEKTLMACFEDQV